MWRTIGLVLTLFVLASTAGTAQAKEMEFSYKAECAGNMCLQYILAEGAITDDSATRLESLLRKGVYASVVIFNSPGGSVYGGIKLGKVIRSAGLHTAVNTSIMYYDRRLPDGSEDLITRSTFCASACTLAFLGGTRRTIEKGAMFGLHGFRSYFVDMGEAAAQKLVAVLLDYADEMGADREMIQIASATPAETMHWIKRERAVELRIDNSEQAHNQWVLDAHHDGTVFGRLEKPISTEHGEIKVYLFPNKGVPTLVLSLECGSNEANENLIGRVAGRTTASLNGDRWRKSGIRNVGSDLSPSIAIDIAVSLERLIPNPFSSEVVVRLGWADKLMSMEEHLLEPISFTRSGLRKVFRAVARVN